MLKEFIEKIKKHWLVSTSITVLLIISFIVLYIALNIWVNSLNITAIDFTKDKLFTLSDQSKEQIQDIDQDTTIYALGIKDNTALIDLMQQYGKANKHIQCEVIEDLNTKPEIQNKYNLTDGTSLIVIESGENTKILSPYELTSYDYTTGQEINLSEQKLTNGILNVTAKERPILYFLTGHNEYGIQTELMQLAAYLEEEANEVKQLNIVASGEVPEDCSVLVICNPIQDFNEYEVEKITDYINQGGKILWMSDINFKGTEKPNVQKILDLYGIGLGDGILLEQDANRMVKGVPNFIMPVVNATSDITKEIASDGLLILINATKITMQDTEQMEELKVTATNLLTTSSEALYRTDLNNTSTSKISSDEEGSSVIATELTKQISDDTSSKMIVFGTSEFITNAKLTIGNQTTYPIFLYNNKDVVLNAISVLNEREDTITIRKNTQSVTYTANQIQHYVIMAIIFIIPLLIVIAGIVVWQMRRRKK